MMKTHFQTDLSPNGVCARIIPIWDICDIKFKFQRVMFNYTEINGRSLEYLSSKNEIAIETPSRTINGEQK